MIEIPISISLKGNSAELSKSLYGLGEKQTNPEFVKLMGDGYRVVNSESKITDGVIIKAVKGKKQVTEAYVPHAEILAIISIFGTGISISELAYKITNWLIDKTHNFDEIEIKVKGEKVTNIEEIKKLLEDIIEQEKKDD